MFQYLGDLGKAAKLPSIDELVMVAKTLHLRYSSPGAFHNGMLANTGHPSLRIPDGQPWTPPVWLLKKRKKEAEEEEMRRLIEKEKSKSKSGGKELGEQPKDRLSPFFGDTALAES